MIIAQLLTFIIYLTTISLMNNYINTSALTMKFFSKVLIIVGVSWLPVHIIKQISQRLFPTDEQKIDQEDRLLKDIMGVCVVLLLLVGVCYGLIYVE